MSVTPPHLLPPATYALNPALEAPVIRGMRTADLAGVIEVENSAYDFPWSKRLFRDCLRVGYDCLVLCDARRMGGHAVVQVATGEAHLLNLCVAHELQGHGHGRSLLEHVLERARRAGALNFFLEVRPTNVAARSLYLRSGFAQVGRRPRYYPAADGREDALVMSLDLRRPPAPGTGSATRRS